MYIYETKPPGLGSMWLSAKIKREGVGVVSVATGPAANPAPAAAATIAPTVVATVARVACMFMPAVVHISLIIVPLEVIT